jgi:hypothetical protein
MSFVVAAQEALVTAASDLAGIGSTLGTASAAAAVPTTGVLASAADQVSEQVAALLSEHGLGYQQLSAQLAKFHEQFVQTLGAGTTAYAAAEANAAQTLANAVNAPAAALLGSGAGAGAAGGTAAAVGGVVSNALGRIETVLGNGAAGLLGSNFPGGSSLLGGLAPGGVVSNALGGVESLVLGNGAAGLLGSNFVGGSGLLGGVAQEIGAASQAGALLLGPTGGIRALTAASAVLAPATMTNAAVAPTSAAFGDGIKFLYNTIEPYVRYGFDVAAYVVGFLPYVGFLYPQIYFFYDLFEPIVQSGLFNILDWLGGSITFVQGLNNFFAATAASINRFINTEINWFLSFLPPLPPLPPFP